jgi:hypothetical protein
MGAYHPSVSSRAASAAPAASFIPANRKLKSNRATQDHISEIPTTRDLGTEPVCLTNGALITTLQF